jgi:multidrug resistance efflux pump
MRISRPLFFWLLTFTLLAGSAGGAGWVWYINPMEGKEGPPPPPPPGAVCIGHVDVDQGITDLYPVQPGQVAAVPADEDKEVAKGTVLLRLDDRPYLYQKRLAEQELESARLLLKDARKLTRQHELQLAQQEEAIKAAEASVDAARHTLEDQKSLADVGARPGQIKAADSMVKKLEAAVLAEKRKLEEYQLLNPATQIARAEADVKVKEVHLEQAQYALEQCNLCAPTDGKVLRVLVSVGETLGPQPKQPALQFCPHRDRIVRAEVDQESAGKVYIGQDAVIEDDSTGGGKWTGKVERISDWYTHRRSIIQEPLQFNDVRTLECIIRLDPSPSKPRIGQRVRVNLKEKEGAAGVSDAPITSREPMPSTP